MSDAPQGPGWWQASDLRWYPPESRPTSPAFGTRAESAAFGTRTEPGAARHVNPFPFTEIVAILGLAMALGVGYVSWRLRDPSPESQPALLALALVGVIGLVAGIFVEKPYGNVRRWSRNAWLGMLPAPVQRVFAALLGGGMIGLSIGLGFGWIN